MSAKEKSQSIERAVEVLRAVGEARNEPNLSEIMATVGLGKTVVLRILSTLTAERMLDRNPLTGRYRLGGGLVEMAQLALQRHPLLTRAAALVETIVDLTGDIGLLMVREARESLCISRVEGRAPIATVGTRIGTRSPLHCGGGPMAILAFSPDEMIDEYLSQTLARRTARTVTDPAQIRDRIAHARDSGYIVGNEDLFEYVVAIGIPVYDSDGRLLGSLSIGNINHRFPPERCAEVGAEIARISRTMLG